MSPPPGIRLIKTIRGKDWNLKTYRYVVLLVTFVAYTCYHASRKPSSIVKSVLDPDPKKDIHPYLHQPWPIGDLFVKRGYNEYFNDSRCVSVNNTLKSGDLVVNIGNSSVDRGYNEYFNDSRRVMVNNSDEISKSGDLVVNSRFSYEGWAPFNGSDGTSKLGEIDVAFLACYSLGMYVAGHLGDSLDLRLFLTTGMIGSGMFVGLFGLGFFWNIHSFSFYLVMQMVAGLFQATGWPSVVAVIGNWFGKRKRGLIMGVWNAHTSVGNISGSLLAASVLEYGWGWSFILPGGFICIGGVFVYLFLAAYPEDVGFPCPNGVVCDREVVANDEEAQLIKGGEEGENVKVGSGNRKSVGLFEACLIPGVIPFALCLFFAKLVAYTFLYWLPFYLTQTAIGGEFVSVKTAGNLSTLFDVGGIVGGILAGYISDKLRARATTAATFMYAAIPALLLYRQYGNISKTVNIILMMIAGLFVNGPYALITTAVSADLGTHSSVRGDARALATVTAIIDGTGSVGAALGPLLTGFLSSKGWDAVFIMLMIGALIAGLLLSRLVVAELTERNCKPRSVHGVQQTHEDPASQPLLSDQR